jgi:hypothetical protein
VHIISKILGSILVLLISGITLAFILSATLFNAHYYQAKANDLHLYDQLATSIPDSLSHDDPSIKPALQQIVSSPYIQSKLNPFLDQIQQYYFNNGPAPKIDFTDFVAEAQRQGITIPADSNLSKPVVFQDPTGIRSQLSWINFMKTWGLLLAALLAVAIVAVNKGIHRFTALGKVLIVAGIWEGVIFLLLKVAPGPVESLIKGNSQIGPLAPVLTGFFKAVLTDMSVYYGYVAVGLAAAGGLLIVAGLVLKMTGRFFHRDASEPPRFTRPNPDNRPAIH